MLSFARAGLALLVLFVGHAAPLAAQSATGSIF